MVRTGPAILVAAAALGLAVALRYAAESPAAPDPSPVTGGPAPLPPGLDPRYWRSAKARQLGLDNTPPPSTWDALYRLQAAVGAVEAQAGSVIVSSAYRSPVVNNAVGGVWNSAHLTGGAVDLQPRGQSMEDLRAAAVTVFRWVYDEDDGRTRWLHCEV